MGKSFYQVNDDRILVSGRRFLSDFRHEVSLRDLSPQIERLGRRFYRPIVYGVTIGGLL